MSLVIENGSVVTGAESYVSAADLQAYAAKRDVEVPGDAPACEVLLIKAMDYMQAQEQRLKGNRVSWQQPLAWPRYGVCVNGYELLSNVIPNDIKAAQMALAIEANTLDLMPTVDAAAQQGPVIEETVDVLTTKYAAPAINRASSSFAKADGLLAKFYTGGINQRPVVRA